MSAPPPPAAPPTAPEATAEQPGVLPEAAGATPAAAAPGAAAPAAAAAATPQPNAPVEEVATANDSEAAAATEQAASEARGGTTGSPDAFPANMSLEDRLRREPSEKVNDADILFSQVVGKLVLYNHKPLETDSGDKVMDLYSCVAEKPAAYNAPLRIQNKIYPMNVFKVVKEWKDNVAVFFTMARTGNGNANAVVYMALESENEAFSGAIEEISVLKLFPAERTTASDDSLAVAVASMNAWVAVKKKGRGGRRVEAEMRAAAAAAKERDELAEKEKNAASEREQAKALKEKEKAERKAEKEKDAAAAAAAALEDDEEEESVAETLEKVRWVKMNITSWTSVKKYCNKKAQQEIVCRTLKLPLGTTSEMGNAIAQKLLFGKWKPEVVDADADQAAAAAAAAAAATATAADLSKNALKPKPPPAQAPAAHEE